VINQVSKMPENRPFLRGTFGMGSGWYVRGAADVNQPVTDSIAFRVNGMAQERTSWTATISKVCGSALLLRLQLDWAGRPNTVSYLGQYEDNLPTAAFLTFWQAAKHRPGYFLRFSKGRP
jgi:outer membrane receptor for monomeric catechols